VGLRMTQKVGRRLAATVAAGVALALSGCGGLVGDGLAAPNGSQTVAPVPTRTSSTESTPVPPAASPSTQLPSTSASTSSSTSSPAATPSPTSSTTASTPSATTAPTTPSTTASTPSTTTAPAPPQTPTPPPRTTLLLGDRGPAVLALQERLSDLGYWLGTPDGVFGGLTQQAVFAVQKAGGIGRDGVVGPKTKAALEAGVRPASRVGGTGVEIDLDRQLLLIVRDGAVIRILNTSTGNGEEYVSRGTTKIARTPTGSFAVFREVDALEVAELGELYRPKYFYRGWAVHGSTSVPPYPASHGCARVTNAAINMIWAQGYLDIGTPVTVY